MASPIQVLSLDVGGTLLRPYPGVGEIYAEVLSDFGIKADPETLERGFRSAFKAVRGRGGLTDKAFWREVVGRVFSDLVRATDFPAVFEACFETFAEGRRWQRVEGVFEVMSAAQKCGLRVIAFSNNDSRLHQVMAETGLSEFCEHIFVSAELGWEKPAEPAFAAVARAMDLPREVFLHCGDDCDADAFGAAAAGWRGIWLSGEQGNPSELILPPPGQWSTLPGLPKLSDLLLSVDFTG
jgi:2-haloacid dehalogenase